MRNIIILLIISVRNIGILTQAQCCISSSSSDSTGSDDCTTSENTSSSSSSDCTSKTIEPEVNQDHYASPFQRQSAKDGAKVMTCFALFVFLIFNPLSLFAGETAEGFASSKLSLVVSYPLVSECEVIMYDFLRSFSVFIHVYNVKAHKTL